MSAPRLIQLCDFARPQGGSFIPLVRGVMAAAAARGWTVEAAFFGASRECPWVDTLEADGVKVHFAPEEIRSSDFKLTRWLEDVLGPEDEPVVLHSHFHGFDVASALAARGRKRLALVWHIHSVYPRDPVHVLRASAKLGILGRRVDAMLCPADNIVQSTKHRLAPRARVHFMPSAIAADAFPVATPEDRAEARERLGVPADATMLLHFGWHWHLKGGDVFLDAAKILLEDGNDRILAVERGGHDEYETYSRQLGIQEQVLIVDAVDDVRDLHAAADVLVSPSRTEGMAYALLEALMVGTPVVATDIAGHAYLGRHMDACRITEQGAEAVAAGIAETLARPPEQAEAERRQAREWVETHLAIPVVANELIDRYEELLTGRP